MSCACLSRRNRQLGHQLLRQSRSLHLSQPRVIRTWQVGKDAATLEEAVQKAQAGDIVVLPEGKFVLARGLIIDKALTLRGAGRDKTHVISTAADFVVKFTGPGPWIVENIHFTHTGPAPADVLVVASGSFTLKDSGLTGGKRDPSRPNSGHGLNIELADAVAITNCVARGTDSIGIHIAGQERGQYTITSCSVENCELGVVTSSGKFQIIKSTVEKCRNVGIQIRGESTTGQVEGCIIRGNGSHGVEVGSRARAVLHKNQAIANALHGLAVYGEADVNMEGNVCTGNGHFGIEYHRCERTMQRQHVC